MDALETNYIDSDTVEVCAGEASPVIPLLQVVQEKKGYIPEDAVAEISEITGVSQSALLSSGIKNLI